MRRKEKQMKTQAEIEAVIKKSTVCRIGLCDQGMPYVVPVSFGYRDKTVYVHGAREGKKNKILAENPNVCVEFDLYGEALASEIACDWGVQYQSVLGFGTAESIGVPEEKKKALAIIMAQYAGTDTVFKFPEKAVKNTAVYQIKLTDMTGKKSGFE